MPQAEAENTTTSYPGVFRCVIPVKWGDMDALNHVNNAVYFQYMEEARAQLFQCAGLAMPAQKIGILAHVSCDFLKPIYYPETIEVRLAIAKVGRSSLTMSAVICQHGNPGQVYAKSSFVLVGANATTGKIEAWTSDEMAAFERCLVTE